MKNSFLRVSLCISLAVYFVGSSEIVIAQSDVLPALPPVDADALTRLMETRYNSAQSYDYWHCGNGKDSSYVLLPEKGTLVEGVQQGLELHGPELKGGVKLIWEATSATSFKFSYPEFGATFDYTELSFTDINSMQLNSRLLGALECMRNYFGASSAPLTSAENDPPVSTAPQVVGDIEGLVAMYGFFRVSGLTGIAADAVFAFDDGTYTKDIAGVVNDGAAASRANNPKAWGVWQGTALALKESDEANFKKKRNSFQIQPGSSDQRLDRCYNRVSGIGRSVEGGVGVFASSTFCFFDNGRFTSDASVWNQGPAYDATSVNPQSQGRYSIEGQFIDFIYDDGTTVRKAFGFTEKNDWSQIWLNSPVYLE